jgi:autotransporter adhesin
LGVQSSAYGGSSKAFGDFSSAYGVATLASGGSSNAYGFGSTATSTGSNAYGTQSHAVGNASAAFGSNASAIATNSVALGAGSIANQANTVLVGAAGSERRITNVAPGINPTDAVNMSQFSGLTNDLNALRSDIVNVASSAYRGIAGVAALTAGITPATGKTSIDAGVGAYKGYAAGAITASHTTENGRFNFNGGIEITSGAPVYRAGIGFSF